MASKPILVIRDTGIVPPDIEAVLLPTSVEEGGQSDTDMSMIKIIGKLVPLVKINNRLLEYDDVLSFRLESVNFLPTLTLTFRDVNNTTAYIDTLGPDDYIHIQILPKFDGVYKKINLMFYVNDVSMNTAKQTVTISAVYSVPGLNDSMLKSFGKVSTYEFFEEVCNELDLGFCTNIDSGDTSDSRYIYLRNNSYLEALKYETSHGGSDLLILDSWIDFYSNINLIDLYDLYNGGENWTDQEDGIMIWCTNNINDSYSSVENEPYEIEAIITNNPKFKLSELYSTDMKMKSNTGKNMKKGTDRGINIYDINKNINVSKLFQDGSGVANNVYTKSIYAGEFNPEVCDNSNYMFQPDSRNLFIQKINNNLIEITTSQLLFGLMRGAKVNIEWYDNSILNNTYISTVEAPPTNSNVHEEESSVDLYDRLYMAMNNRVSGQYIVTSTEIKFNRNGNDYKMVQKFILSRVVNSDEASYTKYNKTEE